MQAYKKLSFIYYVRTATSAFIFGLCLLALTSLANAANWSYRVERDEMTSMYWEYAQVRSDKTLNLAFPYTSNINYGTLLIRKREDKLNPEIYFLVDKGQILCPSYGDGCQVSVRFDEAQPVRFEGKGSSDHSGTEVFIRYSSGFMASAKKAKKILIQVIMYQAGRQTLEFTTTEPLQAWIASGKKTKK